MISPRINKNCSKYQAIELIFQKTGDCMKRFFILLPFAFFSFFAFAQTKLELYKDMVTTDNLRLRTPYAENKIITVLNKGTKVKIIDIEDEKETIDGITSNWVTVEVQKNAKDKDGNPVKYAVVGRCFAGYLKETPPISYVPNYENGNGTIIEQTGDKDFYILKRKHRQKLKLGEMADDYNIYKYINKNQVLVKVTLDDRVDVEELWLVQSKKDLLHYVWLKVSYNGVQGFVYYSGAYYSNYYKKYIDGYSDPYQNNRWEILEKINVGNRTWTVRKVYQGLSIFSENNFIEVRDKPGVVDTTVIAEIPLSYKNGNRQTNIITEAITEEYDGSYRNRWVRITVDGKTGWISGAYLSAERGGPTYYIPEDWIAFLKGDAP